MKKILFIITLISFFISCQSDKNQDMDILQQLIHENQKRLGAPIENPEKFELQILYTQIDRDEKNHPHFTTYRFREDANQYFYPASTVKMPTAFLALEKIIDAGVHRILTSGQKATAFEGRFLLRELVKKSNNRITILAGAGINRDNILNIAKVSKTNEFHLSGKSIIKSPMSNKNTTVQFSQNGMSEDDYFETNVNTIKVIVEMMGN